MAGAKKQAAKSVKQPKQKRFEVEVGRSIVRRHQEVAIVEIEADSAEDAREKAEKLVKDSYYSYDGLPTELSWEQLGCEDDEELEDVWANDAEVPEDD
jgi:hypothetical protein